MRRLLLRLVWRLVDWQTKRRIVELEIENVDLRDRLEAITRSHRILMEEIGRDSKRHRAEIQRLDLMLLALQTCPTCGSKEPQWCGHNDDYAEGYEIGDEV